MISDAAIPLGGAFIATAVGAALATIIMAFSANHQLTSSVWELMPSLLTIVLGLVMARGQQHLLVGYLCRNYIYSITKKAY